MVKKLSKKTKLIGIVIAIPIIVILIFFFPIQTITFLVFGFLVGFAIFVMSEKDKPKEFGSEEERIAYERRKGEVRAEKEHQEEEERDNRPIETGFSRGSLLFGSQRGKRK